MNLLLDEHISALVAKKLRENGYTVYTVSEIPSLIGLSDREVVRFALEKECAVVTSDTKDFRRIMHQLLERGEAHFGLICIPSNRPRTKRDTGNIVRSLLQLLQKYPERGNLKNQEVWLPPLVQR